MIIVGGCSFTDKEQPKSAQPMPLEFKNVARVTF